MNLRSVTATRFCREVFIELVGNPVEFLCLRQLILLLGDVGPFGGIFGIDLEPLVEARFGIRLDSVSRAFRFAHATIDAFVRVNDEHVLTLVEAVHRTYFNAIGVLALDAIVRDDIGHDLLLRPAGSFWCVRR
jgi:hypothetical protein